MSCKHMNFGASVKVARMEDTGRFMADITINCAECGEAFCFQGLRAGLDMGGASMSIDGQEARMAITPASKFVGPLDLAQSGRHG